MDLNGWEFGSNVNSVSLQGCYATKGVIEEEMSIVAF